MVCGERFERNGGISIIGLEVLFETEVFQREIVELLEIDNERGIIAVSTGKKRVMMWKCGEQIELIGEILAGEIVRDIIFCNRKKYIALLTLTGLLFVFMNLI